MLGTLPPEQIQSACDYQAIVLFSVSGAATAKQHAKAKKQAPKLYDEVLNPHPIEHPNHLGFNDLHIQAIHHLVPDTHDVHDPKLQVAVHHHCKAYDDGTLL